MHPVSGPPSNPSLRLAVLGIGQMGLPMAQRLVAAGFAVTVWNRSRSKAEQVRGAAVAANAAEAVREADVVISLLENGDVVQAVLFGAQEAAATEITAGAAAAMRPGCLVIDMASIQPAQARDHAQRLAALGVAHLDAPVSGGTLGAENGTLAIMVGGSSADFARAAPVFAVFGRATHVGTHGTGQLAKLANQMIVGITIGAVAEALLLCQKGGADMARVIDAMGGGFADSRILQVHGQRMAQRDFAPRGRMAIQLKDLRNALGTAQGLGFDAPITVLFEQLYAQAIAQQQAAGLGELDHSGLFVELARRNAMQ
ncbi:MAG: NAD(P)-dependent oxidoreductase [Burkholderiaceae bacterium]